MAMTSRPWRDVIYGDRRNPGTSVLWLNIMERDMTLRLDSNEQAKISDSWSPAGEIYLQLSTTQTSVLVAVQARLDGAADFATITRLHKTNSPMVRLPPYPSLRLALEGNLDGEQVTVVDYAP